MSSIVTNIASARRPRPLTDLEKRRIRAEVGRIGDRIRFELIEDDRHNETLTDGDYYELGRLAGHVGLLALAELDDQDPPAYRACGRCSNALLSTEDRQTGCCVLCREDRTSIRAMAVGQ